MLGVKRIREIISTERPDVVVLQNDPWNIPHYLKALQRMPLPVMVGAIAIDSKNARGYLLNSLDHVIFWTEFAQREAELGGMVGPASTVIGLGVDRGKFYLGDKRQARQVLELPERCWDAFIIGNVNRNQPRKRIDLTLEYVAEWYHSAGKPDAYVYLHVCPTGDVGVDVEQLAKYYGLAGRLIYASPDVWKGVSDDYVRHTYNAFDVQINTAVGEGWGLTTLEGMACGVPQIVPDWAALGEWPGDSVYRIPVTPSCAPSPLNQIGGILKKQETIKALDSLYSSRILREESSDRALACASEPRFEWPRIGEAYNTLLGGLLDAKQRRAPGEHDTDAATDRTPA